MKNEVKITEINDGVDVHINGDVKFKDIESLTQSCGDGACSCSPEMLSKIEKMQTHGKDGDVHITLTGKALGIKEIQSCMTGSECDCGF